jgi:hypothetical protein
MVRTQVADVGHCLADMEVRGEYTLTISGFDYRRGLDWRMDLLTTYTHDSDLQSLTALSLTFTLYKSFEHTLNNSGHFIVCPGRCLVTALNNVDSSASVRTSHNSSYH